jgi:radial spoke head protein 9
LNDQHKGDYDGIKSLITGNPNFVHKKVEIEKDEEALNNSGQNLAEQKEYDPLASSESEDENAKIVPMNLKEIDRIHYIVRAIENDCHIIPNGSFKLTTAHEVSRNEAFKGLP